MPHIVRNFRMSRSIRHYYNVTTGVGRRRRNERRDVLLVQFLLNNVHTRTGTLIQPSLVTDGIFGSKTEAAIKKFQDVWNADITASLPRLEADGVVSPGRGRTFGAGGKTWTILALNALVGNEGNFGLDMYCRLHTHPDCPPALRSFFASAPPRRPPATPPSANVRRRLEESGRDWQEAHMRGLRDRARARRRINHSTPRPYDRSDPGVRWAQRVLRPGRSLFTPYEYSEILETMEGTGDLSVAERKELLLQIIGLITGDLYPSDVTVTDLMEFMRQEAALGGMSRPAGHAPHY